MPLTILSADPARLLTEGEAFVYAGGGVGVFGEVGVPEAAMKEKKWTRIVISLGALQRGPTPGSSRSHVVGSDAGDVDGDDMDDEEEDEALRAMMEEGDDPDRIRELITRQHARRLRRGGRGGFPVAGGGGGGGSL